MAILLFRLNGVPADEAEDIRTLLAEHRIGYYETDAGRWGVSVAAIWLTDDSRRREAEHLIEEYQQERARRAREQYALERENGKADTTIRHIARHPVRFAFSLAGILLILYLSLVPLFNWR